MKETSISKIKKVCKAINKPRAAKQESTRNKMTIAFMAWSLAYCVSVEVVKVCCSISIFPFVFGCCGIIMVDISGYIGIAIVTAFLDDRTR